MKLRNFIHEEPRTTMECLYKCKICCKRYNKSNVMPKPEGNLIHDVIFRIDNLKEILKSKLETIKNEISQKSEQQKVIENDLEISTNLNTRDLIEVNEKLCQLENTYEKSYEVPTTGNPVRPDYIIATGIYLREKSISDDAFLREDKLKFGKLTVKDNQIFMHSLSLDEIPKDSKTVQ
ncbi:hypothetical protein Avbf_13583, partial [Armadillidium vulgare]